MSDYDVIVIGSGPGGEGAALKCAKEGKRVIVIEENTEVGGNCTHRGTIPSKALRHAVQLVDHDRELSDVGYERLFSLAKRVIGSQVKMRNSFYIRNRIHVIKGYARFIDAYTIEVTSEQSKEQYKAKAFVIATGARPYHPHDIDFSHPRIVDSDTILQQKVPPRSITIYGAGIIGCEYASVFRELGVKVNLINKQSNLLFFLDDEIIDALCYHLREKGIIVRHNEIYQKVEANEHEVRLYLKSNKQVCSDILLWAEGRSGNSDKIGLESIEIERDERGSILVNKNYQTLKHSHIYAVGDVIGYPSLASAAYDQGRFAATHLVFGKCGTRLVHNIPTGIYTIPEISSIGFTERELTHQKVPYEVGRSLFRHLARAQIVGEATGMLKILFHRETLQVLGIHCFGSQSSEIIHIGQAIMSQEGKANTLMYFINTTFNYPTMAEAYRVAALNGLNRVR
jgi:NAD(P) transhydrogenase